MKLTPSFEKEESFEDQKLLTSYLRNKQLYLLKNISVRFMVTYGYHCSTNINFQ